MRPIFTIHAGEFLFGEKIEKDFRSVDLWIPAKDKGVDFLITSRSANSAVKVQVKMSKNYAIGEANSNFERALAVGGWFNFTHAALKNSPADYWSLILVSHERKRDPLFINVRPSVLLEHLVKIHGNKTTYTLYPWVLKDGRCIEGRSLNSKANKERIANSTISLEERDLTAFLGNWDMINNLTKSPTSI